MRFLHIPCRYVLPLFSALFVSYMAGIAQPNWSPNRYHGIPDKDKNEVFSDEFVDNRSNWDLKASHLEVEIDEDLYCYSEQSEPTNITNFIPINHTGNYEVELRLRYVRGNNSGETGLVFGGDSRGNTFYFLFSPQNKTIKIYKQGRTNNDGEILLELAPYNNIQYYSNNTLTVRKVSDSWYFFFNRDFIGERLAYELYGNDFGFKVGANMGVEVDYLTVKQIRMPDVEGPTLSLLHPRLSEDSPVENFNEKKQIIKGRVEDASGVSEVLINDTPISVEADGTFTASVVLPDGPTKIEIVARDNFRNQTRESFYMAYQPKLAGSSTPRNKSSKYSGKNYLLMIGVNKYDYWSNLHNAVKDCNDIANELVKHYQFERENVVKLTNDMATRENILEAFEDIQSRIGEDDNLLIYYAGHGYYDEESGRGYWVPSDARLNKISDFIRNSTIHDYMKSINSHHTFLIADACYAGSLFSQSRSVIRESARSRWAFTSGDIEKVWDGQPGQNSPFARYLLRSLRENQSSRLRADHLINEVVTVVKRNTSQTPLGLPLREAGDEGGIFVFIKKQYAGR